MQTVSGVERIWRGHPQRSAQKMAMATRAREEIPVRELKSQGSTKLVTIRLSIRKRPTTKSGGPQEGGSGANVGHDAKNPREDPPKSRVRYSDEKQAETEKGPEGRVHGGLKEKVLADAGCGILQGLGHEPYVPHAGEDEDAMAEVLALHQEIDGKDDDNAECPDGAQEAHDKFGGGAELGAFGIHDANGLSLREWLLGAGYVVARAGRHISADVLDGGESLFQGMPGA